MSFTSLLVLLGLALTCLGCAIYGLVVTTKGHSIYVVWIVIAAILVYGVMCIALVAYWRKRIREKNPAATRQGKSLVQQEISLVTDLS